MRAGMDGDWSDMSVKAVNMLCPMALTRTALAAARDRIVAAGERPSRLCVGLRNMDIAVWACSEVFGEDKVPVYVQTGLGGDAWFLEGVRTGEPGRPDVPCGVGTVGAGPALADGDSERP